MEIDKTIRKGIIQYPGNPDYEQAVVTKVREAVGWRIVNQKIAIAPQGETSQ